MGHCPIAGSGRFGSRTPSVLEILNRSLLSSATRSRVPARRRSSEAVQDSHTILAVGGFAAVQEHAGVQRCLALRGSQTRLVKAIPEICAMAQSSSHMPSACLQMPDEVSGLGADPRATKQRVGSWAWPVAAGAESWRAQLAQGGVAACRGGEVAELSRCGCGQTRCRGAARTTGADRRGYTACPDPFPSGATAGGMRSSSCPTSGEPPTPATTHQLLSPLVPPWVALLWIAPLWIALLWIAPPQIRAEPRAEPRVEPGRTQPSAERIPVPS